MMDFHTLAERLWPHFEVGTSPWENPDLYREPEKRKRNMIQKAIRVYYAIKEVEEEIHVA